MMFGRAPDAGEVAAALHDTMIAASIYGGTTTVLDLHMSRFQLTGRFSYE